MDFKSDGGPTSRDLTIGLVSRGMPLSLMDDAGSVSGTTVSGSDQDPTRTSLY